MLDSRRTIGEVLPAFAAELEELSRIAGRPELAVQIRRLTILELCGCGDSGCAHFYTAPKPAGAYGPGHANVNLPAERGLVILDVVDGLIVAVEVLDWPDVETVLDMYLPSLAG